MIKRTPKPKTPNPTTPIPITDPPAKAISNAFPNPVRAALVVLTLAFVATLIPMNPASAEHIAPTKNDTATRGDDSSLLADTARRIATEKTKNDKNLYSDLRKAIAPSEI